MAGMLGLHGVAGIILVFCREWRHGTTVTYQSFKPRAKFPSTTPASHVLCNDARRVAGCKTAHELLACAYLENKDMM